MELSLNITHTRAHTHTHAHTRNSLQSAEVSLYVNSSLMTTLVRLQLQSGTVSFARVIPLPSVKTYVSLIETDKSIPCIPTKQHTCTSSSITRCHSSGWMGEKRVEKSNSIIFRTPRAQVYRTRSREMHCTRIPRVHTCHTTRTIYTR